MYAAQEYATPNAHKPPKPVPPSLFMPEKKTIFMLEKYVN